MVLGCFSYGLSIVLFVLAMRNLGSARTSALFATSPFIGAILAFILYRDIPNVMFFVALPVMILGTFFLLQEDPGHEHEHEELVHDHPHAPDIHHRHTH